MQMQSTFPVQDISESTMLICRFLNMFRFMFGCDGSVSDCCVWIHIWLQLGNLAQQMGRNVSL